MTELLKKRIRAALLQLDTSCVDWTVHNRPSATSVSRLVGEVVRAEEIEAAWPGFTQEKLRAHRSQVEGA